MSSMDCEEPSTSHASSPPDGSLKDQPCRVCGAEAEGVFVGVYACRACTAFFRRTVLQKKAYLCKKNGANCPVGKNGRTGCKQCRFVQCLAVGMLPENVHNRLKSGDSGSDDYLSEYPLLKWVKDVYQMMCDGRREEELLHYPLEESVDPIETPYGILRKSAKIRLNELMLSAVPYMKSYCLTLFPKVPESSTAEKMFLFRQYLQFLLQFEGGYRSARVFPGQPLSRQCTLTTYFYFPEFGRSFVQEENDTHESLFNFIKGKENRCEETQLRLAFERLALDDVEVAAISAIAMWNNDVFTSLPDSFLDLCKEKRERLFSELHAYYTTKRRLANSAARFGEIMTLFVNMQAVLQRKQEDTALLFFFDVFDSDSFMSRFMKIRS